MRALVRQIDLGYAEGHEIGTHYNGHFCEPYPGNISTWSRRDWRREIGQFHKLMHHAGLAVPDSEIRGGRTPCLQGQLGRLYPVLRSQGMTYDTSQADLPGRLAATARRHLELPPGADQAGRHALAVALHGLQLLRQPVRRADRVAAPLPRPGRRRLRQLHALLPRQLPRRPRADRRRKPLRHVEPRRLRGRADAVRRHRLQPPRGALRDLLDAGGVAERAAAPVAGTRPCRPLPAAADRPTPTAPAAAACPSAAAPPTPHRPWSRSRRPPGRRRPACRAPRWRGRCGPRRSCR